MRWRGLFDDLEAQFEAAQAAELAGEVAERTRRESALLRLADRLRAAEGAVVAVALPGAGVVRGRLLDAGVDWLLLEEAGGREVLVPLAAVLGVTGVGPRSAAPDDSPVAKRLDLRWALRGLARSRTGVALGLVDGALVTGTLDRVAADHLDLAEHGLGEARRPGAVRQVRLVPLTALALVRSG
jgi:phosphoglycolate phosphatase-like HAD superfamily hydrolase